MIEPEEKRQDGPIKHHDPHPALEPEAIADYLVLHETEISRAKLHVSLHEIAELETKKGER